MLRRTKIVATLGPATDDPKVLDEMIAAQAQYIRGYLMKDGKLYLSLMADGGAARCFS